MGPAARAEGKGAEAPCGRGLRANSNADADGAKGQGPAASPGRLDPAAEGSEAGGLPNGIIGDEQESALDSSDATAHRGSVAPTRSASSRPFLLGSSVGEALVLLAFVALCCVSLVLGPASALVPRSHTGLFLAVSSLGLVGEMCGLGKAFQAFAVRPGVPAGLHVGLITVPAALLARAVLHGSAHEGSSSDESLAGQLDSVASSPLSLADVHQWAAFSFGVAALAGTLALFLHLEPTLKQSSSSTHDSEPHLQRPADQGTGSKLHDPARAMQWRQVFLSAWAWASFAVAAAAAAHWRTSLPHLAVPPAALPGVVATTFSSGSWVPALWGLLLSLTCGWLFMGALQLFPGSFTAGEALLLAQGLTLYAGDALGLTLLALLPPWASKFFPWQLSSGPAAGSTGHEIHAILQAMVLGLLLLPVIATGIQAALLPMMRAGLGVVGSKPQALKERTKEDTQSRRDATAALNDAEPPEVVISRSLGFAAAFALIVLVGAPAWLRLTVGMSTHPIKWAIDHILEEPLPRVALCLYWLAVAMLPLPLLRRAAMTGTIPHILVRKFYHLMAVCMFVPALILQPGFLSLAFGVALCAFLLLEIVRVCRVAPLARPLDAFMRTFADARDSGPLIVSHFSLLLGCALPLWLTPFQSEAVASAAWRGAFSLAPFAGIVILGIGDTMASFVGKNFGRTKVASDSPKTLKGTAACMLFSFCACSAIGFLLVLFRGPAFSSADWESVAVATIIASLLEAYTQQLDNAFVPLVYYAAISLC